MSPLPDNHPWVTHGQLPTFQHCVDVMEADGYRWDQDDQVFEPPPESGRMPLDVLDALAYIDPVRWTDQSGDVRNLPPPIWPSWLR